MTGKQLKNSILQLAIQGKLVPQDPHDEPASELLKRIRKEKEQLVKTGKLKKKDLESTPIAEDEKPFEIPETWEWCRISDTFFVTKLAGFEYTKHFTKQNVSNNLEVPIVRARNVRMGAYIENKEEAISLELSELLNRCSLTKECLLMTFIGAGIGDTCIFPNNRRSHLAPNVAKIEPFNNKMDLHFVMFVLMSGHGQKEVNSIKKSTAQPSLSMETIRGILLPVPPLMEQHRIVEKIEELMPLVEEYDKAQSELDKLNESLPEQLKKSILQQAIMGKLVPQDPNDEPASELLKRIHKEKENLVKSGALKKKDLITTPISDDEKPFDIPESWEWVRIGDIFAHNNGKQLNRADTKGDYHDYITTSNLYWDRFDLKEVRQMLFTDDELIRCTATKGDLLVCEGGDIGRSAIWNEDYDICIQNHIHRVRAYSPLCTRYFLYLLMFNKAIGLIGGKGIGIQGFSAKALHNTLVALPPLSEQHRIVAKIEELFSIL